MCDRRSAPSLRPSNVLALISARESRFGHRCFTAKIADTGSAEIILMAAEAKRPAAGPMHRFQQQIQSRILGSLQQIMNMDWVELPMSDYGFYLPLDDHRQASWSPARSSDVHEGAQMLGYEDNFGFLDIGGPEEQAFFDYVQRQSVLITCERCERPVRFIPAKTLCASCVSALECGAPASLKEYGCSQKPLLDPTHPT
jgi:hypothetical protein